MSELRIKLEGSEASLGEIPARDVANLLLSVELAVMRAASVVLGRPKTSVGRAQGAVERAARLRLRAIEEGSVIPVLELPEPEFPAGADVLELEVASLAESAVEEILKTVEAGDGHPVVASALVELSDKIQVGHRYESVTFDLRVGQREPRTVRLDQIVSARLGQVVEREGVRVRDDTVVGTLVEADFEKNSARLRGPLNEPVTVSFDGDLADQIQQALRRPATLQGKVVYDPKTLAARSVRITSITPGRQLVLGIDPDVFWVERSFADLAHEQGGAIATQPDEIYDADATEEEREAFMAALSDLAE